MLNPSKIIEIYRFPPLVDKIYRFANCYVYIYKTQKIACGDFFRLARIHAKETRKFVELSTIGESLET